MEEEEEYIDLQDIEILDEELDGDYNPSDEEILAYAEYLGFDLERDQELLVVAYQALKTPLPENWKRAVLKNSQEVLYINLEDQTLHTYSPIDEAAILHYREQKEIMNKKSNSIQPATKVIPRAKNLPPIEKGEKTEKNKKSKLDKLNLAPNFSPEKNTMTNDLNTDLKNKGKKTLMKLKLKQKVEI